MQSRSRRPGVPSQAVRDLAPARVRETYSAGIKLALVARGEADVYLNDYVNFHDWDICAGQILVEEAGGTVTGLNGENYFLPSALRAGGPWSCSRRPCATSAWRELGNACTTRSK